jgi:hypothetical protein
LPLYKTAPYPAVNPDEWSHLKNAVVNVLPTSPIAITAFSEFEAQATFENVTVGAVLILTGYLITISELSVSKTAPEP